MNSAVRWYFAGLILGGIVIILATTTGSKTYNPWISIAVWALFWGIGELVSLIFSRRRKRIQANVDARITAYVNALYTDNEDLTPEERWQLITDITDQEARDIASGKLHYS